MASMTTYLRWPPSQARRGPSQNFAETSAPFCNDRWVLDTVRHGYELEFTSTTPPPPPPTPIVFNFTNNPSPSRPGQTPGPGREMCNLRASEGRQPGIHINVFSNTKETSQKHHGQWRPVRMDSLRTVLDSLILLFWAALLELADAYLHVPIRETH